MRGVYVGCGQCMPCRINRRRMWTVRQWLESLCYDAGESCFVTLTYNEQNLPENGSLLPRDLQLWLKRFRKCVGERRVRFYACGEYGDITGRPHYHLSLFGVGPYIGPIIKETWKYGFSSVYEFNEQTAAYICGYVTKKWTDSSHPLLKGRHPEFARMSNRPGIGARAMVTLAEQLCTDAGMNEIEALGDVPKALRTFGKIYPLGRYLREKLREEVGVPEEWKERIKQRFYEESKAALLAVLEDAINDHDPRPFRQIVSDQRKGRIIQLDAKERREALKRKGRNTL